MAKESKGSQPLDNLEWELFCQHFVLDKRTFNNQTRSLAIARNENPDRNVDEDEKLYQRRISVLAEASSRLVRNPKISARITFLFEELLENNHVDAQLSKSIQQDFSWDSKVAAIREFNKLRQRIVDKQDITSAGKPLLVEISEVLAKKYKINSKKSQ